MRLIFFYKEMVVFDKRINYKNIHWLAWFMKVIHEFIENPSYESQFWSVYDAIYGKGS